MQLTGLILGLVAMLHALVGSLALSVLADATGVYSLWVRVPITFGLTAVLAWALSRWLRSDEQRAPAWHAPLLAGVASISVLCQLAAILRAFGPGSAVVRELALLTLAGAVVLTVRLLTLRAALFLGVAAMALQFDFGGILGLLALRLPTGTVPILTLAVALAVAWTASTSTTSAAERCREPAALWTFGAAGALVLMYTARESTIPGVFGGGLGGVYLGHGAIWSVLGWLVFLGTFLVLVTRTQPQDGGSSETARTGAGTLLMVFLALYTVIAMIFHVTEYLVLMLPTRPAVSALGTLVAAAIAAGFMFRERLAARIPHAIPGRACIIAGLIALGVAIGGSALVSSSSHGGSAALGTLVFLVVLGAPLIAIGKTLVGIGTLQLLFNLESAPGTSRAQVPRAADPA